MESQAQKASRLLDLHHAEAPLVLINVWDSASACIVEQAGFPAIATSSAAVANALGHADGQHLPWPVMTDAIRRIVAAVRVPVTADIEAGFSSSLQELDRAVEQLIDAGAAGINLEDALPGHEDRGPLYPAREQVERIRAVRNTCARMKTRLVINARTDAYWENGRSKEETLRNTLERGQAYLEAGADCIFVPGLKEPEHIRAVVGEWKAPINILAGPGVPSVPELAKLGVKRISMGSGPMRAAMGLLRRIAEETTRAGTYTALIDGAVPYAEMNALFKR
ncbi:MAG TPA: isocitrate lyase/phosphoenolpyruvate mutase family protein [Candidatus Angelobacter sp.]